jgi:phage gp45-like
MQRATPADSSFRGYSSGGSRSMVSGVDDSQFMQEMAGSIMKNEARSAIEAAQNFGFSSVVKSAIMNKLGGMVGGAETFMSFMGGNRSFPAAGNMDDRRNRMMNLSEGDSGMFSTQGRKQQVHMSDDGMYHSVPQDQTMRMALLDEDSEKDVDSQSYQAQQTAQEPGGPAHKAALAALLAGKIRDIAEALIDPIPGVPTLYDPGGTGSATSGTNAAGTMGGLKMGQNSLRDKNKKAGRFFQVNKDSTQAAGKIVQLIKASSSGGGGGGGSRSGSSGSGGSSGQQSGTVLCEASSDSKFYCGGTPQKGKFALIVTVKGPTINVPGKIG